MSSLSAQMREMSDAIAKAVREDDEVRELVEQAKEIAESEHLHEQLANCLLAEGVVGIALLVGLPKAPLAAVALGLLFIAALFRARARGVRRLDCGCFGSKKRRVEILIARAAGFTALAALSAFETPLPTRNTLIFIVLAALTIAVVVLGMLVLALYRQVGVLTLRMGPGVALELAEEGPSIGTPAPDLDVLVGTGHELVMFFSEGCRLCRQLAPAVRALASEGLPVRVVYENEEAMLNDEMLEEDCLLGYGPFPW